MLELKNISVKVTEDNKELQILKDINLQLEKKDLCNDRSQRRRQILHCQKYGDLPACNRTDFIGWCGYY